MAELTATCKDKEEFVKILGKLVENPEVWRIEKIKGDFISKMSPLLYVLGDIIDKKGKEWTAPLNLFLRGLLVLLPKMSQANIIAISKQESLTDLIAETEDLELLSLLVELCFRCNLKEPLLQKKTMYKLIGLGIWSFEFNFDEENTRVFKLSDLSVKNEKLKDHKLSFWY